MLDTVILKIRINPLNIVDNSRFEPSTEGIFDDRGFYYYKKCVQNPTSKDKEKGYYKPRLTVYRRPDGVYLKIEFSAPKLVFGNNLEELEEADFEQVIDRLYSALSTMGIRILKESLINAPVSAFHPSKNIPLSGGYTSIFAIRELSKVDVSKKFDIERVKFRNGGEALQIYCVQHSLVFYDKVNDMDKPAKRAIDKDQTAIQKALFEELTSRRAEILRMELRFSQKVKLNEILESLGYAKDPKFKDIFNKELCRKLISFYWNKFFSGNTLLFDARRDPQLILQSLLKYEPKLSISKAIEITGFMMLGRDDAGMRGFRNIVEVYRPKINWTKLKEWIDRVDNLINSIPLYGFIADIERELGDFRAYRVKKAINCFVN